MDGWLVTVAVFKEDSDDDEEYKHVTYAVAVSDPTDAVKLSVKDSGAKAAMLNCPMDEEQLKRFGLKPGELIAIHDNEMEPVPPSRPRLH